MPPSGSESSFVSSGMFSVVSVWRPAPNVSSARPSRKKIAAWLSRTTSCAPSLISAEPCAGKRETIVSGERSRHSMTSMNCDMTHLDSQTQDRVAPIGERE